MHTYHTLRPEDVRIHTTGIDVSVSVLHEPTGIVVICRSHKSRTRNKDVALYQLSEQVEAHYAHLKEKAMPTVEKAYDKIILSQQDVQKALKDFILKTIHRQVRGDVSINTHGNGITLTGHALLEDAPSVDNSPMAS